MVGYQWSKNVFALVLHLLDNQSEVTYLILVHPDQPIQSGRAIIRRPVRGVPDVDSFLHSLVDFLYGDVAHSEDVDVLDVRLQDVRHRLSEAISRTLPARVRADEPLRSHT